MHACMYVNFRAYVHIPLCPIQQAGRQAGTAGKHWHILVHSPLVAGVGSGCMRVGVAPVVAPAEISVRQK